MLSDPYFLLLLIVGLVGLLIGVIIGVSLVRPIINNRY